MINKMLEKKTTDEISFTQPTNKVWVSQESELEFLQEQFDLLEKINVHYIQNKCYDVLDDVKQNLKIRISELKGVDKE